MLFKKHLIMLNNYMLEPSGFTLVCAVPIVDMRLDVTRDTAIDLMRVSTMIISPEETSMCFGRLEVLSLL